MFWCFESVYQNLMEMHFIQFTITSSFSNTAKPMSEDDLDPVVIRYIMH